MLCDWLYVSETGILHCQIDWWGYWECQRYVTYIADGGDATVKHLTDRIAALQVFCLQFI